MFRFRSTLAYPKRNLIGKYALLRLFVIETICFIDKNITIRKDFKLVKQKTL